MDLRNMLLYDADGNSFPFRLANITDFCDATLKTLSARPEFAYMACVLQQDYEQLKAEMRALAEGNTRQRLEVVERFLVTVEDIVKMSVQYLATHPYRD